VPTKLTEFRIQVAASSGPILKAPGSAGGYLLHYVRAPQLHDALRPRASPSRDDAQLDDDDDERRLSDDAPAPDASVISPSEFLPFLVMKRTEPIPCVGSFEDQKSFG
jgi:hypothetical protein